MLRRPGRVAAPSDFSVRPEAGGAGAGRSKVVNAQVALPRERRRWLRAVRHRLATGRATTITPAQLQGWDAFERMVREQRPG